MFKKLALLFPFLTILLGGCSGGINPVTGISLDKTELSVEVSQTATLTASIEPKKATNQIIKWESSDIGIATVSTGGVVTGIGEGKTEVRVITEDGGYVAKCAVTVIPFNPQYTHATNIVLSKQQVTFNPPTLSSVELDYTIFPEDAHEKDVVISSTNDEVVTVSKVEGKDKVLLTAGSKAGKASVKVALKDLVEGKEIAGTCAVETIYPTAVTGVKLDKKSIQLDIDQGETTTLVATVEPSNASNKQVLFSSDDENVAKYEDGMIVAKGIGNTTITVRTVDGGFTDTCQVAVTHSTYRPIYIDFDALGTDLGSNAHIHYYGGGKSTEFPGIALDSSKYISKDKIILSNRETLNRDLHYWDVPTYSENATFTKIVDGAEVNKWDNFSLSQYNLFQPVDWEGKYNNYNVYKVTLTDKDGKTSEEYSIPAWSSNGYNAPNNTSGYKWVYEETQLNYINGTDITSDINLVEVSRGTMHTIIYDLNGAELGNVPTQEPMAEGEIFVVADINDAQKFGYDFKGWSDGVNTYYPSDDYVVGNKDVVLTAQWEKSSYTYTYFTNNKSWSSVKLHTWTNTPEFIENYEEMTYVYTNSNGEPVYRGEVPNGYKFQFTNGSDAWSVDITSIVPNRGYYLSGSGTGSSLPLGDWTVVPFLIEFDANGGEGSMETILSYNDSNSASRTLPKNVLTKSEFCFAGWSYTSGGEVAISDEGIFPNGKVTTPYDKITLFAKWSTYKIKVNSNEYLLEVHNGTEYRTVEKNISVNCGDIFELYIDGVKKNATQKNVQNNNIWNDSGVLKACLNITTDRIYVDFKDETPTVFCGGLNFGSFYLVVNDTPIQMNHFEGASEGYDEYIAMDVHVNYEDHIKFADARGSSGASNVTVFNIVTLDVKSSSDFQVFGTVLKCIKTGGGYYDFTAKLQIGQDKVLIQASL